MVPFYTPSKTPWAKTCCRDFECLCNIIVANNTDSRMSQMTGASLLTMQLYYFTNLTLFIFYMCSCMQLRHQKTFCEQTFWLLEDKSDFCTTHCSPAQKPCYLAVVRQRIPSFQNILTLPFLRSVLGLQLLGQENRDVALCISLQHRHNTKTQQLSHVFVCAVI